MKLFTGITMLVLLAVSFLTSCYVTKPASAGRLWTAEEKEYLLAELERSKDELLREINGITEEQWNFRENPERWSISEIAEHLITQDESYTFEMRTALRQPELHQFLEKTKGNDSVFIKYSTDTLKADAGLLTPFGRYCSQQKTIQAYHWIRNIMKEIISTTDKDFRMHFTFRSYVFDGHLANAEKYNVRDMHQLMLTCIAHTDRHLNQIHKVKQHISYPRDTSVKAGRGE